MTSTWVVILNTGLNMTIQCHDVVLDVNNNLCFYNSDGDLNTCFANGYWLNYARMEKEPDSGKHGYVSNSATDADLIYVWCDSCKGHVEFDALHVDRISEGFEDHMQHKHPEDYKS